jgi:DNA-binding transcriptional ArsR family regulator
MTGVGRPRADRDVFRAIADPTRRATLEVLARDGEQTVSGLVETVGVEMPVLSRHLAVLREAGLVTQKQAGRNRLYSIEPEGLRQVFDWAALFTEFWTDKIKNLQDYLDKPHKKER